jgi:hypothetical protein
MPLSAGVPPVLGDEEPRHQSQRGIADHQCVGLGGALQARGHVERVAERQHLGLLPAPHLAHHHRAGVDPHSGLQPHAVLGLEPGVEDLELAQDLAARPHRPLGVVLVGLRVAEVDQQPIAQVLGHLALAARDRLRGARVVGLHDPAVGLGGDPLRQRARADQIAEQDRQVPALAALGERRRRLRRLRSHRQLPPRDRVERLEQRLHAQVALLRLARRDGLEELPEPVAEQPLRDLHRATAREQPRRRARLREGVPSRQALEEDEFPRRRDPSAASPARRRAARATRTGVSPGTPASGSASATPSGGGPRRARPGRSRAPRRCVGAAHHSASGWRA